MSVLDRAALEASPLADLHASASGLSIDSYGRLRRAALIDAILERQGAENGRGEAPADAIEPAEREPEAEAEPKHGHEAEAEPEHEHEGAPDEHEEPQP